MLRGSTDSFQFLDPDAPHVRQMRDLGFDLSAPAHAARLHHGHATIERLYRELAGGAERVRPAARETLAAAVGIHHGVLTTPEGRRAEVTGNALGDDAEDKGAGMDGTTGFNASCDYRYFLLDADPLARNLADGAAGVTAADRLRAVHAVSRSSQPGRRRRVAEGARSALRRPPRCRPKTER